MSWFLHLKVTVIFVLYDVVRFSYIRNLLRPCSTEPPLFFHDMVHFLVVGNDTMPLFQESCDGPIAIEEVMFNTELFTLFDNLALLLSLFHLFKRQQVDLLTLKQSKMTKTGCCFLWSSNRLMETIIFSILIPFYPSIDLTLIFNP